MNPVLSIIALAVTLTVGFRPASAEDEVTGSAKCRSWFARSNFDSASSSKKLVATSSMHGCTADNRGYHGNGFDFLVHGERIALSLRSLDYPEVADALDQALKVRAHDGISKEDESFALNRLLPAVEAAAAISDEDDRREAIAQARSLWKDYLLGAVDAENSKPTASTSP